jgi:hypothetical protein
MKKTTLPSARRRWHGHEAPMKAQMHDPISNVLSDMSCYTVAMKWPFLTAVT